MRRGLALVILLWLPSSGAASGLRIEGFAADLPGPDPDDAIWLRNPGSSAASLEGVWLDDGQGRIGFPEGATMAPGATLVVASRAEAFLEATGMLPDLALHGLGAQRTMQDLDRGFSLGLKRDDVRLGRQAALLDRVVYGDGATEGEGWTGPPMNVSGRSHLRWFPRVDAVDDDDRSDWQGLGHRILGVDAFPAFASTSAQTIAYTAPESSRAMVVHAFGLAKSHLRINVYQWRDLGLLDALRAWRADNPDARLDVLLAPNPVGENRDEYEERAHVVQSLRRLDAAVHLASRDRYAYNHAKYIVIDAHAILVQSENFVPRGIPQDGATGNRGYGVLLADPALAAQLARIFDEDFRLEPHGATQAPLDPPSYAAPILAPHGLQMGSVSRGQSPAPVWLICAPRLPDPADDPILQRIANASRHVRVAQLDLPPSWRDAEGSTVPNPYLRALLDAAARGVRVEILLDGNFIDPLDGKPDNEDTRKQVAALSLQMPIAARLQHGRVLHAKTMIVDDVWTLVGSMNWNANSVLHNREVGLLVGDPAAARLHAATFDADWQAADPRPGWIPVWDVAVFGALAAAAWLAGWHSKRSYRGPG